ncbi:MAG: hydroxyacylglutathione hydrolase [Sphingomonadaceae bacterium]|nr:hydroxyacylglutathione hydrolase [Sphingomonadaceae bacterium]
MVMALEVAWAPALRDNYIWLLHDPESEETVVVDPSEAAPALAATEARGWTITQVWNTHWHPDHTGGNAAIKAATGCAITGPAESGRIPTLDRVVGEGEAAAIGGYEARVLDIPAHTSGHIAFHLPEAAMAFTGDTLFAMGCGRLFEGSAADMFAAMRKLEALPPETRVYCGHEYTQANGRYALVADPENQAIVERMREVDALRERGEATLPTTIALERATNPFMRAASVEELAARRAAKDAF